MAPVLSVMLILMCGGGADSTSVERLFSTTPPPDLHHDQAPPDIAHAERRMTDGELRDDVPDPDMYRRKLQLKAKLESNSSYVRFKGLVPGAFNVGFMGSTW